MKKKLSTILQLILFTGIGVFIIYYMAGKMTEEEKQQMFDSLRQTRLWMLVPVFIVGFLSHYFRSLRWRLLLKSVDVHTSKANTLYSVLVGYITNLFLPRLGEVAKCTVLARYEKAPVDKSIGTIVAERLFDMVCLMILVGSVFILQRAVIGDFVADKLGSVSASSNMLLMGILFCVVGVTSVMYVMRKHAGSKLAKLIRGIGDGLLSILKLKERGLFLWYSFMIWMCYWFLVMLGFWSLPATQHLGALEALVVLVFGSFGMIATQGGIGAYTYLCAEILVFYGIEYANGTAFGWLSWLVQTGVIIILGVAAFILLPLTNKKKNEQASLGSE